MKSSTAVTFFKPQLSHFVETMACFLATDPQVAVRLVTSRQRGSEFHEHQWSMDRLDTNERIDVVDIESLPVESTLVVFGLVRHSPQSPALPGWLRKSEAAAIFPETSSYGSRADWLRELARSFPAFLRARFLILEREARPMDFRFGCRRRVFYTPSVHPQFLSRPALREVMFGAVSDAPRRFRITFMGNRQPPERSTRLDACLAALRAQQGFAITTEYRNQASGNPEVLWIEYDFNTGTRGIDPELYASALTETEFCLSPPGWGRNWAHRTVEAMVRGAIPVIEDPELYNLPFVDGVNCLIVGGADWAQAVQRCLTCSPAEITRLRGGVLRLREERLLPDVAARDFREAFMKAAR